MRHGQARTVHLQLWLTLHPLGFRILRDYIRVVLGVYGDNGEEKGDYYSILGLYRDHIRVLKFV